MSFSGSLNFANFKWMYFATHLFECSELRSEVESCQTQAEISYRDC